MRSLAELNQATVEAFAAELAPLFEGVTGLLTRLAAERPFESEADMWAAARAVARSMPEPEQIELLDAHPAIGADPSSMSAASLVEQGYGDGRTSAESWVADELAALNEAYEARFGFRFVVFVAGRPRSEILPLLERAVTADRDEELRRGLDDAILIAADRRGRLASGGVMPEPFREAIALEVSRHLIGELDTDGLVRAAGRLVSEGVESPALLALSLSADEAVAPAIGRLMAEIGLADWDREASGHLLALHAAASVLGDVSQPIDGARRIVAMVEHPRLRELIARWESSPEQREAIDVMITREASDLFEAGAGAA